MLCTVLVEADLKMAVSVQTLCKVPTASIGQLACGYIVSKIARHFVTTLVQSDVVLKFTFFAFHKNVSSRNPSSIACRFNSDAAARVKFPSITNA